MRESNNKSNYPVRREQFLERPLPSNEDAERAILGAILLDNSLFAQAAEKLKAEHFYSPINRRVFWAMQLLFNEGTAIDPILIGEVLKRDGSIESMGGVSTITNLTYGLPHFTDIGQYVDVVFEKAQLRELIRVANQITSDALEEEDEPGRVLLAAQSAINAVTEGSHQVHFSAAGTVARDSFARVRSLAENGKTGQLTGVTSGFQQLDFVTNGFQPTDLIILGGRPNMGKSAMAGNISENVPRDMPGAVVAVFTPEMSKEQYVNRMIGSSASVPVTNYSRGTMGQTEWERASAAVSRIGTYDIEIDESGALSVLEMKAKALTLRGKFRRLDLIVVDFLQKLLPTRATDSRQQEISQVARELKSLAKELRVPVLALSSLSREVEKRKPPIPMMSDLRESGDIESEADIVMFLYREHFYNTNADPKKAELIVSKNRHGATPHIPLIWLAEFTRFENVPVLNY